MAKYRVGGNLVVKIDDSGGTLRDLSAYVEWVSPVGVLVEAIDVTVFTDIEQRTLAGVERAQEFTIEGLFDDTASTGPDAVLSGIVGKVGSYQVGTARQPGLLWRGAVPGVRRHRPRRRRHPLPGPPPQRRRDSGGDVTGFTLDRHRQMGSPTIPLQHRSWFESLTTSGRADLCRGLLRGRRHIHGLGATAD